MRLNIGCYVHSRANSNDVPGSLVSVVGHVQGGVEQAADQLAGEELVMEDGYYKVLCRRRAAIVHVMITAGAPEGLIRIEHGDDSHLSGDGRSVPENQTERNRSK